MMWGGGGGLKPSYLNHDELAGESALVLGPKQLQSEIDDRQIADLAM
jgi:hypothetical protein